MKRAVIVLLALLALAIAGVLFGVSFGSTKLGLARTLSALVGNGDNAANTLVWDIRAPRVLAALVAGACLGGAGALLQGGTRNPLGDPQLFGVGGGAAI